MPTCFFSVTHWRHKLHGMVQHSDLSKTHDHSSATSWCTGTRGGGGVGVADVCKRGDERGLGTAREREREGRKSAHSRLAQAPVREREARSDEAAWLRLMGEATCASRTGWRAYRRTCTGSRWPTWPSPVSGSLRSNHAQDAHHSSPERASNRLLQEKLMFIF